MNDPAGMCSGQTIGDRRPDLDGLPPGKLGSRQPAAQRLSFQKLHDGEGDAAFSAKVVNRQDVRM